MKLKQVLEFVRAAPIMMSASQEVELIEHICALTDEELVGDFETLAEVLSRLYESHAGSAVFEVDDHNLPVFVDPREVNWEI